MKAVILLALVSAASYGFSVPEVPIDKPGEFLPAIGFHIPNQPAGVSPRIIGGNDAAPHAHPHQVSLQRWDTRTLGYKHLCGGSVVGADKIITAAHCIYERNIADLLVVAGEHNIFDVYGHEQFRAVRSAIAHPLYNRSTVDYDFAVIRLSSPLTFNQYVSPITLTSSEPKFGNCVNTGWGCTDPFCEEKPDILQEVTIPIVPRSRCVDIYRYNGTGFPMVTGRMICAGAPNKGPCRGDSGGPLVCNGQLAGIVSWGNADECAVPPLYPGVFANIDAARPWLDSQ